MVDILLFHHIQGLTPGVGALAERLRAADHLVHTPDLYGGRTFASIEDGFAFMKSLDASEVAAGVDAAADALPADTVFAGISWGVGHAQRLAQTRPHARGAVLLEACYPVGDDAFGPWPPGLPAQIHGMDRDEFFALEGDLDAARELVAGAGTPDAEVFAYPGDAHLFTDASLPASDPAATDLVVERILAFLDRIPAR